MDIAERVARYQAIEDYRKRPLIVYATSTRGNVPANIASDTVREFIDQIDKISADATEIDVLIHSNGGDALAAWKLMSLLRERFTKVHVLVPLTAFSAATIFALGADEIVMHPHASLGPIDPQITMTLPDGKQRRFAFEDVGAFLRFLNEEIGITEQAHLSVIVDKLFSVVDPVNVGAAKRASELATDVGERLLRMHMVGGDEKGRARSIAEGLNKSFFAHGDAVSRKRAKSLELRIAKSDPPLERLMWSAYLGIESYMELRSPFNPLQLYLAKGGAAAVQAQPSIPLPSNLPSQIAQQIWNGIAQQALQAMGNPGFEVSFALINAVVESPRLASEFRTEGSISAARMPGGQINLAATDTKSGWENCPIPAPAPGPRAGQP